MQKSVILATAILFLVNVSIANAQKNVQSDKHPLASLFFNQKCDNALNRKILLSEYDSPNKWRILPPLTATCYGSPNETTANIINGNTVFRIEAIHLEDNEQLYITIGQHSLRIYKLPYEFVAPTDTDITIAILDVSHLSVNERHGH